MRPQQTVVSASVRCCQPAAAPLLLPLSPPLPLPLPLADTAAAIGDSWCVGCWWLPPRAAGGAPTGGVGVSQQAVEAAAAPLSRCRHLAATAAADSHRGGQDQCVLLLLHHQLMSALPSSVFTTCHTPPSTPLLSPAVSTLATTGPAAPSPALSLVSSTIVSSHASMPTDVHAHTLPCPVAPTSPTDFPSPTVPPTPAAAL